jgi:hydrogenase expression/formation protein HypE
VTKVYPAGKLPPDALRALLARYAGPAEGLLVGPGVGVDAAAVACRTPVVAASDPITFTGAGVGAHAVHVNANDVACLGARPRWFLATLLLPEGRTDGALVDAIFREIAEACARVGAHLCGGHTEVTPGLDRPIVVGTMLGEPVGAGPLDPRDVRPGDAVLLTKGIAVEGTAILARDFGHVLAGRVPDAALERARAFLHVPGIGVVREALAALEAGGVRALHDPTEGGLAQGLWEWAEAAGVGFRVRADAVPVLEETRLVCDALGLDPWGLLASGALLLAVAPDRAEAVAAAIRARGVAVAAIGVAVPAEEGVRVVDAAGRERPLPSFERDELARFLEERGGGDPPARDPGGEHRLLYDGDCAFCRAWVDWIRRHDRGGAIRPVPFQDVDPAAYGLTRAALEEAMHLVAPDGRTWRGAAAAREIVARLPRWRWAAWALRVPGALWVAERVYRWIARRRHRFACGSAVCRRGAR